jgi:hypothetical protein
VVERLRAHPMKLEGTETRAVLPPSGVEHVTRSGDGLTVDWGGPSRPGSRPRARVALPEVAQRPFLLKDEGSGVSLEVAMEDALPARAEVVDGYVVYAGAHPEGGDVLHRFTPEGTEDYVSFSRAPASPEVRYALRLGEGAAGLRLIGDTLEVLDTSGDPRLHLSPPYVVGADGRVTQARVSVEGCAVDTLPAAPWGRPVKAPGARRCRVRVGWNAGEVEYPAVLDPSWSTTGSMTSVRRTFTLTQLQNGLVLAAGGSGYGMETTELYNPGTGTWAATGSMSKSRSLHTATLLTNGKVLVTGGDVAGATHTNTTELYSPTTGTWSSASNMGTLRSGHTAHLLASGKVLVVGARYGFQPYAELYDPATNTWSTTGAMQQPHRLHSSEVLTNGKVLVFSGTDGQLTSGFLTITELYDPATNTWSPSGASLSTRVDQSSVRLADGRILVAGGNSAPELYDPATGTWSATGPLAVSRQKATANLLPDGRVLVASGATGQDQNRLHALTELYDPTTGIWTLGPSLYVARKEAASIVLSDGRVLIAGGSDFRGYTLNSAEVLSLNTQDTTAPLTALTAPVAGSTLQGSLTVSASASDDLGVVRVEFYADATLIGVDTEAPYSLTWNSRTMANGPYTLTSKAYDSTGNASVSEGVSITLDNDLTPPTVAITSPTHGSTVEGRVTVNMNVSDNRGVTRVMLYDNGQYFAQLTTAPYTLTWDSRWVDNGSHTLKAEASDAAGNIGTAQLTVTASNPTHAAYDSTLQVPRCGAVSSGCGSDTLLEGRYTTEAHTPNTLWGSCADGTLLGPSTSKEVRSLRIFTSDGSRMVSGKPVFIEVTLYSDAPSQDRLDLFSAADINNPVWKYITTLTPTNSWSNTLSTLYVLPVGGLQAVRARLRNNGAVQSCTTGTNYYDDHDDLVFPVDIGGSDISWPTTALTAPAEGSTLKGTVTLSANASDASGVAWVEFYDGGTLLGIDTSAPYSFDWSSRTAANGPHTLTSRAYDNTGRSSTSTALTVTVDNDFVAPTVILTAPAAGSLQGTVTLSAEASDNQNEMTRVEFYAGGTLLGTSTTTPYTLTWDSRRLVNGGYTLVARAYDLSGNTGTSPGLNVTLVNPGAATYNSTLKAASCGTVGANCDSGTRLQGRSFNEPNAPSTLQASCEDGSGGAYHTSQSLDRLRVFTPDGSPFAPGRTVRVEATVWTRNPATDKLDLYTTANASSPVWTYLTTLTPAVTGESVLSATFVLPRGVLQAVRGRFRDGGTAASCGYGSFIDHDDLAFAVDSPPDVVAPTVSLTAPVAGATVSGTTTLTASASDDVGVSRVEFYVGTTPLGTVSAAPYMLTWNTTGYPNGGYTLMARAYDAAGNVGQSAQVQVTVSNAVTSVAHDAVLGAPRCVTASASCDSGTLLQGRAHLGPEPNQPNTVDTCTDGTSGGYRSDESLERLKVSTTDGTVLAPGKAVTLEATAWVYSSSSDALDLYYAADASTPAWVFVGTVLPTASGSQVLKKTYTLPVNATARSVVRGVFRYGGSAGSCPGGGYTDVDDLVFSAR